MRNGKPDVNRILFVIVIVLAIYAILFGTWVSFAVSNSRMEKENAKLSESISNVEKDIDSCKRKIGYTARNLAVKNDSIIKEKKEQEKRRKEAEKREKEAAKLKAKEEEKRKYETNWTGEKLSKSKGTVYGPTGKETYYNLDMSGVISIMRGMGFSETEYPYAIREDGVKTLGGYVMVAANLGVHPRGSIVDSSLGRAIVCDTGGFAASNPNQLDVAVAW